MEQQVTFAGTETAPDQTVGQTLRAAREAQGLELADIAQSTRVPQRHLVAIEADAHESLPALPYTVGFIRTYARTVGLPADAIAAQYRAETSKVAHTPTAPATLEPVDESRLPPRWLVAVALALVALIVASVWAWGAGLFETAAPAPPVAEASAPEPQAEPAVTAAATPPAPQPAAVEPVAAPVAATPAAVPATDPAVPATATATPGQPLPGGPVVISSTEEVWFKVYDRATRQSVRMGILQPGETYQVPADRDDLLLWTGKAGALRLTVGGKTLPPLGGPQEMVKDVSLTPASLLGRAG